RKQRASGKDEALSERTFFIRDQFVVGDVRVFTLEYFELTGDRALLWKFIPRRGKDALDPHYSLGSYAGTNESMRANGDLREGERAFHLDGYWQNDDHATYGFFKGQPQYSMI